MKRSIYLLLSLTGLLFFMGCSDDLDLSFDEDTVSMEVEVLDQGIPVEGATVFLRSKNPYTSVSGYGDLTDQKGKTQIMISSHLDLQDLVEEVYLIVDAERMDGYTLISDFTSPQVVHLPKEEIIEVSFVNPSAVRAIEMGDAQDVSLSVTTNTRPKGFGFNAATAIDGLFQLDGEDGTYACPQPNAAGDIPLTFIRTGDSPMLSIKIRQHDGHLMLRELVIPTE
jgi:hypothetical protein